MAKAGFLSKKSGFMMMDTETSNGFGSDKGNVDAGFCGLGLQPFASTVTTTTTSAAAASAFKSPGMAAAAACLRYPFTSAQWQELERQALIFKYMMASIPVPPDLLLPTARTLSNTPLGRGSCFNIRFANGADPEPGRCRRTDGKKWRCSRDVAPDQKYCERHMHRSRPRSRKHVEVQTDINNNSSNTISSSSIPPPLSASASSRPYPQPSVYLPKPDFKSLPMQTMATATPYKDSRGMDWMIKGENAPMLNHDLQQLMQGKGISPRNTSSPFQQQYQDNSYTDFSTGFEGLDAQNQSDHCCLYLNPELESMSEHRQMPRSFIDAWSNARDNSGTDKSSVGGGGNGKHSPSTLSLSMSSDNGNEDIYQIQMGLGVIDSECNNSGNGKSQPLSWMTPVPWITSPPGGPLGEVLQSSTVGSSKSIRNTHNRSSSNAGLNLMTDDWGGSRDTSPRATAASSPSGVLHKTLASPSDSSGGNSPTLRTTASRNEFALQWMNQNK